MRLVAAAVGAAILFGLGLPSAARAEVTAEQVRRSIDDAVGNRPATHVFVDSGMSRS